MKERDPKKEKLKEVMSKIENDLTGVSGAYWKRIYKGVLDYLEKLELITDRDAVKKAIKDYIRHQGSDGPQPMWGNP